LVKVSYENSNSGVTDGVNEKVPAANMLWPQYFWHNFAAMVEAVRAIGNTQFQLVKQIIPRTRPTAGTKMISTNLHPSLAGKMPCRIGRCRESACAQLAWTL